MAMVAGVGALAVYVAFIAHHEHHPRPDMPYMGINFKKVPWGDGKTGLFDQVNHARSVCVCVCR